MLCAKLRQAALLLLGKSTESLRMWRISLPWNERLFLPAMPSWAPSLLWDEILESLMLRTAQLWDGRYVFPMLRRTALLKEVPECQGMSRTAIRGDGRPESPETLRRADLLWDDTPGALRELRGAGSWDQRPVS